MECIAIARHGAYTGTSAREKLPLSEDGKAQIAELAKKLLPLMRGATLVLSSAAPRAIESSEIIVKELGAAIMTEDELWDDSAHPGAKMERVVELVKERGATFDSVVVVSHLEHGFRLANFLAKDMLGKDFKWVMGTLKYGEACLFDPRARTITKI